MPLYDYRCGKCSHSFELLVSSSEDSATAPCPRCGASDSERQIIRFRVGGRGDLRESTEYHGCHPAEESHSCSSSCNHSGKP